MKPRAAAVYRAVRVAVWGGNGARTAQWLTTAADSCVSVVFRMVVVVG